MPSHKRDRAVLQQFADTVTWCESQEHLACCGGNGLELHIHHVLGGPHRIDAAWNLVRLCPAAHEWCHNRPLSGRVLCWHLLDSRGMFDAVTIRDRWRQCPLAYIERVLPQIAEDWVRELGERLLERHQ